MTTKYNNNNNNGNRRKVDFGGSESGALSPSVKQSRTYHKTLSSKIPSVIILERPPSTRHPYTMPAYKEEHHYPLTGSPEERLDETAYLADEEDTEAEDSGFDRLSSEASKLTQNHESWTDGETDEETDEETDDEEDDDEFDNDRQGKKLIFQSLLSEARGPCATLLLKIGFFLVDMTDLSVEEISRVINLLWERARCRNQTDDVHSQTLCVGLLLREQTDMAWHDIETVMMLANHFFVHGELSPPCLADPFQNLCE